MAKPESPKSRRLLIVGGAVVFVVVVLFFVVTSGAFLKAVVLPKVAAALQSDVEVEDLSLSLFSGVDLRGVKVTPKGQKPLATVASVRVRYAFSSLLSGSPDITELTVESPAITIITTADGKGNLASLLSSLSKPGAEAAPASHGPAPKFQLRNLKLDQASLKVTTESKTGTNVVEVSGFTLGLDQAGNGLASKLTLALDGGMRTSPADAVSAHVQGEIKAELDPNLLPKGASGAFQVAVNQATGSFAGAAGIGAKLALEATATQLKSLLLSFSHLGADYGHLSMSGTYDLTKKEAWIDYKLAGIGREVMSLVGGMIGFDLGTTTVGLKGRFELAQQGSIVSTSGKLSVSQLSLANKLGTTPKLDVDLSYRLRDDQSQQTLLLEDLTLAIRENGAALLTGQFDRPMNLSFGASKPGFREATYSATLQGFKLGEWRALAGPSLPDGTLKADLTVGAEKDGHRLRAKAAVSLDGAAWSGAGVKVSDLAATTSFQATLDEFSAFKMEKLEGAVTHATRPLADWSGLATYSNLSKDASGQLSLHVKLPEALSIYPMPGLALTAGDTAVTLQVANGNNNSELSGSVSLQDISGKAAGATLAKYQAKLEAGLKRVGSVATLERCQLSVQNSFNSGGSAALTGRWDPAATPQGTFDLHLTDLNEMGLGPWLAGPLGDNRLASARLGGTGSLGIDLRGASTAKLDVKLADLQLDGPNGKAPAKPVSLGVSLDASLLGLALDPAKLPLGLGNGITVTNHPDGGMQVNLKAFQVDLGATPKAKNLLTASGTVDLRTNSATGSSLALTSDGLDLTPLYALANASKRTNQVAAKPAATPAATGPAQEPPAMNLPVKKFDLSLDLKRVFLGAIAISNWTAKANLNGPTLAVDPFQLTLNGAPLSAKVKAQLDQPGYQYDLSLDGKALPIQPLVATFATNLTGQIGGTVTATAAIQGKGVTPPSLSKYLNGTATVGATNLNFKMASLQPGLLKGMANLILGLPELISSPQTFVGNLLSPSAGGGKATGWVDQLQAAPIQSASLGLDIKNGLVTIKQASAKSDALLVNATCTITLSPILTNSPVSFGVELGLKPALGQRIGLSGTGDYVSMPKDCLKLGGTLGNPKAQPDYGKLALLTGKGVIGLVGSTANALGAVVGVGGGTNTGLVGNIANGLGSLFGGSKTNAPGATNQPSGGGALDLLKNLGK